MNNWYKSSYSDGEGGNCVEVALPWHKSSYSDGGGGECVEVAEGAVTGIRDTRHRDLGHLAFPAAEFTAFLEAAKHDTL